MWSRLAGFGSAAFHDQRALRRFAGLDVAVRGLGPRGLDPVPDIRINPSANGARLTFPLDLVGVPPRHGRTSDRDGLFYSAGNPTWGHLR